MTLTHTDLDQATLRQAYAQFPCGVVAIAADIDGVPVGLAASSFVAVSIEPPLVAVCIQNTSSTWPKLEGVPRIGVSVLGEAHNDVVRALAAKTGDRFAGLEIETTEQGAVFIGGATAWLDITIDQQVPAGDHLIVLMRIHSLKVQSEISPIVFHGSKFRRLQT